MTALEAQERSWSPASEVESPFAAGFAPNSNGHAAAIGFAPWSENIAPFETPESEHFGESDRETLIAEALSELRDESFNEALAYLVEETEHAVAERFTDESASTASERERFGEMYLSEVRYESHRYLDALAAEFESGSLDTLTPEQLVEALNRFDPETGTLTPASEEFVKAIIRKAKGAVKFATKAVKAVGKTVGKVASAVVGPVLKKLKALINPILRRVLAFAVNRLPVPLQGPARKLASRIQLEAEALSEDEAELAMSPANLVDPEALAESFDEALAEALVAGPATNFEHERSEEYEEPEAVATRQLEALAEARSILLDRVRSASDEEDLAPAIEQFVPALIGALRLGIKLIGRPKVVGFLAKYLAKLIQRWVGPKLSQPLSNAIVDTGLRLISLESPDALGELDEAGAAQTALVGVIEDTVRRLAEAESFVLEDEALMELATSEAFAAAVATHFPPRFVKPALQQAPTLGGTFVVRRARSPRPFSKYSRTPEVEITEQIADALPAFGGATLGSVLRAAGVRFPCRARMHIYQAAVGTTVPRTVRIDRPGAGPAQTVLVLPLTRAAAGLLLREPGLGVDVPAPYMRSPQTIAAGQRFYLLEPIGSSGVALPLQSLGRAQIRRLAPSRMWTRIDRSRRQMVVGFFLAEAEAQKVAEAVRAGHGAPPLLQVLQRLINAARPGSHPRSPMRLSFEDSEESEDFEELAGVGSSLGGLRRRASARLRRWLLPNLAAWLRENIEAFSRAVADPAPGVTIEARLAFAPGFGVAPGSQAASRARGAPRRMADARPTITFAIVPGQRQS